MKLFLRILSVIYLIGASLHVMDLLDLRLHFSEMNLVWKGWILYLCVFDFVAAIGLWYHKRRGISEIGAVSPFLSEQWLETKQRIFSHSEIGNLS